jgi:hypothetical protein
LAYKESESTSDGKARKYILDLKLSDMLIAMKGKENDPDVKTFLDRAIKTLT